VRSSQALFLSFICDATRTLQSIISLTGIQLPMSCEVIFATNHLVHRAVIPPASRVERLIFTPITLHKDIDHTGGKLWRSSQEPWQKKPETTKKKQKQENRNNKKKNTWQSSPRRRPLYSFFCWIVVCFTLSFSELNVLLYFFVSSILTLFFWLCTS